MNTTPTRQPAWDKAADGLLPAIVQDARTGRVLMQGYMNQLALDETLKLGRVTFWSRSKGRLWTKGETSNHWLNLVSWATDCDGDSLLLQANPQGPACHTGDGTCWAQPNPPTAMLLHQLEATLTDRKLNPRPDSHTSQMFARGINKIAQKFGEEAVELVIEAKDDNKHLFLNEAADLLYRFTTLLVAKDIRLEEVLQVLQDREK